MSENQVWTWYPSTPHSMRLAKAMRVVWFVSAIQALGNQNGGVHVMASPPLGHHLPTFRSIAELPDGCLRLARSSIWHCIIIAQGVCRAPPLVQRDVSPVLADRRLEHAGLRGGLVGGAVVCVTSGAYPGPRTRCPRHPDTATGTGAGTVPNPSVLLAPLVACGRARERRGQQ